MHDHDTVLWRCCEKDMVTGLDLMMSPGGRGNNNAGPMWYGINSVRACADNNYVRPEDHFKIIPRLPAESTHNIAVRDPPGCVNAPDVIQHGSVTWQPVKTHERQWADRL